MSKYLKTARPILLAVVALLSACRGDDSVLVAPLPGDAGVSPNAGSQSTSGALVHPLRRSSGLDRDITWGFDAGPDGLVARHPSTGVTISIPKGALSSPVHITVTALHGAHLAYRFEPHGLQFAAPVSLTLSLRELKVPRDAFGFPHLVGGYFPDDALTVDGTGRGHVAELLPVWLDDGRKTARLEIRHFSGYTVASAILDAVQGLP